MRFLFFGLFCGGFFCGLLLCFACEGGVELKDDIAVLQCELAREVLSSLRNEVIELIRLALGEQTADLTDGNVAVANGNAHTEFTAVGVAHTTVILPAADDIPATAGAFADDFTKPARIDLRRGLDCTLRVIEDFLYLTLCKLYAVINGYLAVEYLFKCLTKLAGFIFIHHDTKSGDRFNKEFTAVEDGVDILFQVDVSRPSCIVDNARSGCLGTKLQTLKDCLVILGIVNLTVFLKLLRLCLIYVIL